MNIIRLETIIDNMPDQKKHIFKKIALLIPSVIFVFSMIVIGVFKLSTPSNTDPYKAELVTRDIDNFWKAYDRSYPTIDAEIIQELYLDKGTPGLKGFIDNRIRSAEYLKKVIQEYPEYYDSIRETTFKASLLEKEIRNSFENLKNLYPKAVFPPIYFVIGAFNSAGSSTLNELIIGTEFYGLTPETPFKKLSDWHKANIKTVDEIPHIVAHEIVHFQQNAKILNHVFTRNLLSASIKEGVADFIAELISGRHINKHVHEFANPKETELWMEFKKRMYGQDYSGWLYSQPEDRPADLGYWMGYKIVEAYYQNSEDKKEAIRTIINIRDYDSFLNESGYAEKFLN